MIDPIRSSSLTLLFTASMLLTACSDRSTAAIDGAVKAPGSEGGPCYPNKTCDTGLTCLSQLCVRVPDARTHDAKPKDTRPPDAPLHPDLFIPDAPPDLVPQPDASLTPPTWTQMQNQDKHVLFDVWGTGPDNVYAVGNGGTVLHFDGTRPPAFSWWTIVSQTKGDHRGIWGSGRADVYVLGVANAVMHFDGSAWSSYNSGQPKSFSGGAWGKASYGVVAPAGNTMQFSGRAQWPPVWSAPQLPPSTPTLRDVWGAGPKAIFVVGDGGTVIMYDGSTWKKMITNSPALLTAIWGSSASKLFAVGHGGVILGFDGSTWKQMVSNSAEHLQDVWGSGPADVYAVGNKGTILHFDGTSWKPMISKTTAALYGVWGSGVDDVFAVGAQGTILHFGACDCLVNGLCYGAGDRDGGCKICDPTQSTNGLVAATGGCKISGSCYGKGTRDASGCKVCDPSASTTAWSAAAGVCAIGSLCYPGAASGKLFCQTCVPAKSTSAWSLSADTCQIDSACQAKGATHAAGCEVCDPAKSTSAWTAVTGGCKIDNTCYLTGAKHSAGCAACDPTKSSSAWTVTGTGCFIGGVCFALGATEPLGCGVCDPTKSKTDWTKGATCLVTHTWSKGFGTSAADRGTSVATDSSGNIYVAGYHNGGGFDLGGGPLVHKGSTDLFIASFTASGAHRWSKGLGSPGSDTGYGVAVDSSGNVYLTGTFSSGIDLGGGPIASQGSLDLFVASYSSSGTFRWAKGFGGTLTDYGHDVAVDSSGNVYVTGSFYNAINLGGGPIASKGSADGFVASFTSSGAHRWSKGFGGNSSDYGRGVAVDKSGHVYLVGEYQISLNLGTGITGYGNTDAFVASFTSAGVYRWAAGYGSPATDRGRGVATDSSGNVYVTGEFQGSTSFGGTPLVSMGNLDIFVASYTSTGGHRWSKGFGHVDSDAGYHVAVDSAGQLYLTGVFRNSVNFGGGALAGKGLTDIFVASLSSSTGAHRWSRAHGGPNYDYGLHLAAQGKSAVYVTGYFDGGINFGGGVINTKGSRDVFLLKLGL